MEWIEIWRGLILFLWDIYLFRAIWNKHLTLIVRICRFFFLIYNMNFGIYRKNQINAGKMPWAYIDKINQVVIFLAFRRKELIEPLTGVLWALLWISKSKPYRFWTVLNSKEGKGGSGPPQYPSIILVRARSLK